MSNPLPIPFVYRVHKPGRGQDGRPIVGKLTHFIGDTQPILAITWRNQRGTKDAISEPRIVLLDAQQRGARDAYLRDDNRMLMWRIPIADFLRGGLKPDGEHYVPIRDMEPCQWREWEYGEREVYLEPRPAESEPRTRQLALFGEVACVAAS